jgi:hypothetical protein
MIIIRTAIAVKNYLRNDEKIISNTFISTVISAGCNVME